MVCHRNDGGAIIRTPGYFVDSRGDVHDSDPWPIWVVRALRVSQEVVCGHSGTAGSTSPALRWNLAPDSPASR